MCEYGCRELGQSDYVNGVHICQHNSLLVNYPEVAKQLHPTKNDGVDPKYIASGSHKKYYWLCDICGHEWITSVRHRTKRKHGCPKCAGKYTETVDKSHPYLLEECHPDDKWKLYKLTAGSGEIIRWICRICCYIWMATLNVRTTIRTNGNGKATGCPSCAGCYTDTVDKTHPHLMDEWCEDNDWKPNQLTAGSAKIIKWKCRDCNYFWSTRLGTRTKPNDPTGCPRCAGKFDIFVDESHPHLIEEWHEDNHWKPNQLRAGSNFIIKWKCRKNCQHIWHASLNSRACGGNGCPKCKRSIGEEACERILKKNRVIYDTQYHILELPTRAYDFIFIYNNIIFLLEFDGIQHFEINERFHQNNPAIFFNNQQIDRDKTWTATNVGYKVIRVSHKTLSEGSLEWHLNEAVRILSTSNQTHYFSHLQDYQYLL